MPSGPQIARTDPTLRLTINPKPIDSTSGASDSGSPMEAPSYLGTAQVSYVYAFTTFFPEIRRSTDNTVVFQVRDEFGNDVPDQGCETQILHCALNCHWHHNFLLT